MSRKSKIAREADQLSNLCDWLFTDCEEITVKVVKRRLTAIRKLLDTYPPDLTLRQVADAHFDLLDQ